MTAATTTDDAIAKSSAEDLVRQFEFDELISQSQAGQRACLLGRVGSQPALLLIERAPLPTSTDYLASVPATLARLQCINTNDIYSWHMACGPAQSSFKDDGDAAAAATAFFPDLKINLICPCTDTHVKKYRQQPVRFVTETAEIYAASVRPYMERRRAHGRLNWVYNIIEGKSEAESVIFRTPADGPAAAAHEGFLLSPDLNWDGTSLGSLHLLVLVERRDLWSIRDLRRSHVGWLCHMRDRIIAATVSAFPALEPDQIKLYFHYQPTYYHLHIHVVNAATEPGHGQATGKAIGLEAVIELLNAMEDTKAEQQGMAGVSLSYTLGEAHELWTEVFKPLKLEEGNKKEPAAAAEAGTD